jgi:hypothetical protein
MPAPKQTDSKLLKFVEIITFSSKGSLSTSSSTYLFHSHSTLTGKPFKSRLSFTSAYTSKIPDQIQHAIQCSRSYHRQTCSLETDCTCCKHTSLPSLLSLTEHTVQPKLGLLLARTSWWDGWLLAASSPDSPALILKRNGGI